MKRVAKHRRFATGELAAIASKCITEIINGRDVIAFLAGEGYDDPVTTWYDIRRWIKSNDPAGYANIPMNLRLELPVHNDNPAENQAPVEEKEEEKVEPENTLEGFEPVEAPKKRPGRKPKQKVDGDTLVTIRNQRVPEKEEPKRPSKVMIDSVTGVAAKYEWDGSEIRITAIDDGSFMTIEYSRLQDMLDELPEVIELLGR